MDFPVNLLLIIGFLLVIAAFIFKKKKTVFKILTIVAGVSIFFAVAIVIYSAKYYRSGEKAKTALISDSSVKVEYIDEGVFFDGPGEKEAIIFYPGAKVEYTAYAPLLRSLAQQGIDCFALKMPYNIAIFNYNKADKIWAKFSYDNYYLMGHSLGGAFGAVYMSKHMEDYKGFIMLAAFSTKKLNADGFSVLSIYGSEDGVLNKKKVQSTRKNMPNSYTEVEIAGGNHSGFADYGHQKGDGNASITMEEQIGITVEAILEFMEKR